MHKKHCSTSLLACALLAAACGADEPRGQAEPAPADQTGDPAAAPDGAPPDGQPADGEHSGVACHYTNPFSGEQECRRYLGSGWTEASRAADCARPFSSTEGTLDEAGCDLDGVLGTCRVGAGEDQETLTYYYGGDVELLAQFCANPGGGVWSDGPSADRPSDPADAALAPEALEAMRSTAAVRVSPECDSARCVEQLIEQRGALTFTPTSPPRAGLVLLPGASVDARAYAPLAQRIAEAGYLVAIVPVPGGSALGNQDRIDDVLGAHPSVARWFAGGHSLGGVAAATYAAAAPGAGALDGLVLWASYTTAEANLGDANLPVTSVHASHDGLTTVRDVETRKAYLPPDTRYVLIRGGNHAQFGYYGTQPGDLPALIGPATQAQMVAEATAHFMASVLRGGLQPADPRYAEAAALEARWCERSQHTVANLTEDTAVALDDLPDEQAFIESKPSWDAQGASQVRQHRFEQGQHTALDAPPILTRELWCKHKSQAALLKRGATAAGPAGTCAQQNEAAWQWALSVLTSAERGALQAAGLQIRFAPDDEQTAGPLWIASDVRKRWQGDTLTVTASSLQVSADADLEDDLKGLHYCKLWSPADALRVALHPAERDAP